MDNSGDKRARLSERWPVLLRSGRRLRERGIARTISGATAVAAFAAVLNTFLAVPPAVAQSVATMTEECARVGKGYFGEPAARTDMQYNGQRSDGTHAVNGRAFLENRFGDFACSFRRDGRRMVSFFADGQERNAYLPSGNASSGGGDLMRVTGVSANDVLNVRSGPGTNYAVVGALANGAQVRNLRCEMQGSARWCEIEMMTDMRERGWVNARYLTGGGAQGGTATQLPSPPPVAGAGQTTTVTVRFPAGTSGTELREQLAPGATRRYLLNARPQQFLNFRLVSGDPGMSWRILNPDSTLLDRATANRDYRGSLWQSGNHVIEVINGSNRAQSYTVIFGIN